jgi:hypothetical protein
MFKWVFIYLAIFAFSGCVDAKPKTQWQTLFDGQSLEGWQIINGDVPFLVENGEIIGKTAAGIPTRYLATEKQYGDFILELEMNNAEGENSGIQFRSIQAPQFRAGLTGYQMEVDPSSRAWTGGIFFEGLGQWRHPIIENPKCTSAWNKTGWNKLRIEAKGPRLHTFVNKQSCAYLYDATLDEGYIALQIHSIGTMPGRADAPTRWRNIRILENPQDGNYTAADNDFPSISYFINQLSPHEEANDWILIRPENIGQEGWALSDIANPVMNTLMTGTVLKVDTVESDRQIHLPNVEAGYALIADIQMTPETKGRINYPIITETASKPKTGCMSSFAIFDDTSIDNKKSNADYLMGSVTGELTAKNLSESNRRKRILSPEKWQRIKIVVKGRQAEHWLNAVKVADYTACTNQNYKPSENTDIQIKIDTGSLNLSTVKYRPL